MTWVPGRKELERRRVREENLERIRREALRETMHLNDVRAYREGTGPHPILGPY